MFRIHEHQIQHFARKMRADFEGRMCGYLKDAYGDWLDGMEDDAIAVWVSAAVDKAIRYGVKTEPEIASLMLFLLVAGLDVDETTPWAREVLADRGMIPEGKVERLIELAREHRLPNIEAIAFEDPATEGEAET
ncbi:Hypothetical protein A7982_00093 [Minicystis rosea]|nr:Hypothetical protein A7982_00093 [Minicystis rosea]